MRHPLITHRYIFQYSLLWVVIMTTHTCFLYFSNEIPVAYAVADGLVFNLLVALLSFGFGYAFKYISASGTRIVNWISYASLILAGQLIVLFSYQYLLTILEGYEYSVATLLESTTLWRVTISGFYFSIIILVYYLLKYSDDLQEKVTNEARLEQIIQQTALDALKSQLNPHFIFNSLNSISSLTLSNPERAQQMVIKLSDFLRNSLREDQQALRPLAKELENMQLYLAIERIRFGDRLLTNFDIEKPCEDVKVPNMILQPLYENAIKYGLYETLNQVKIHTKANIEANSLVLTISNPYDPANRPPKGKGIGLKNTMQRLKLLYQYDHMVTTSTTNDTFSVTLHIPSQ